MSVLRPTLLCLAALLTTAPMPELATAADAANASPASKPTDQAKADPAKAGRRAKAAEQAKKIETPAANAPAPKVIVETALAAAMKDPDFALQGEYVGPISAAAYQYQRLGLQVRPTGSGRFEAIQYQGGLPGEPMFRPAPVKLIGKRSDGFLVLSGGPWAVFVEPDHCTLVDRQGQRIGRLERIVRQSPTLGAKPPKDAIVLFDGKDTSQFTVARATPDGLLMEGADMKPMFQDFNLHAEFMLPYMPGASDQGRANSGLYLQSRYEVQVLDSFGEEPVFNGCGSLYRYRKPDLNMCYPPLVWQTYDIAFTAARWYSDGTKAKNARITVWLNGVKVQNNVELEDKTGAGKPEEPTLLPTRFQDHKNPVRFRNIWLVDRGAALSPDFPADEKPAVRQRAGKEVVRPTQAPPAKPATAKDAKPQPKADAKPAR